MKKLQVLSNRPLAQIVKSAIFLAERPLNSLAYMNSKASSLPSLGFMQEVYYIKVVSSEKIIN